MFYKMRIEEFSVESLTITMLYFKSSLLNYHENRIALVYLNLCKVCPSTLLLYFIGDKDLQIVSGKLVNIEG